METNRDKFYLVFATILLSLAVFSAGYYIRAGGPEKLIVTTLTSIPVGLIVVGASFALAKADARIILLWCCASMILLRSVQMWKPGIDFRDELRFIQRSRDFFEKGQLSGYLESFPANIAFAGVFYGLFTVWPNPEAFELLVFFVYPLTVLGYYFLTKEIAGMDTYGDFSNPLIPAIMFLPFAPTFPILPTYYWPQLFGLTILFFSLASLLHLVSCSPEKSRRWVVIVVGLSILLTLVHNISTALYVITILFFYFTSHDNRQKSSLLLVGTITFVAFTVLHLDRYSGSIKNIIFALSGDVSAWQRVERLSFPDIGSITRQGPVMTLAHTGFFIFIGLIVLVRMFSLIKASMTSSESNRFANSLKFFLRHLKSDPITFSFFGFGILSVAFAFGFGGNFLDPVRMAGWASLLVLPQVIPKRKESAVMFTITLLALFFLLVWTVYSPWGSPFGSSHNLNEG